MPDLDMGDVLADAQRMLDEQWHWIWVEHDRKSDAELRELHYAASIRARAEGDTMEMRVIDFILIHRMATTLCEGCLNRTGCDMCCPPEYDTRDFSDWYGGERGYHDGLHWSDFI